MGTEVTADQIAATDSVPKLASKKGERDKKKKEEEQEKESRKRHREAEKALKRKREEEAKEEKRRKKDEAERKRKEEEEAREEKRRQREEQKERKRQEEEEERLKRQKAKEERYSKKQTDEREKEERRRKQQELEMRERQAKEKAAAFMSRFIIKKKDESHKPTGASILQHWQPEVTAGAGSGLDDVSPPSSHDVSVLTLATALSRAPNPNQLFLPPKKGHRTAKEANTEAMDMEMQKGFVLDVDKILSLHMVNWRSLAEVKRRNNAGSWLLRRRTNHGMEACSKAVATCSASSMVSCTQAGEKAGIEAAGDRLDAEDMADVEKVLRGLRGQDMERVEEGYGEEMEEVGTGQREPDDGVDGREMDGMSLKKKLLQFHENARPAYFGSRSFSSQAVRGRRPLARDVSLDYEVDTDDEWQEEDPGESLSGDEEDEEEEVEKMEGSGDEEDGFVVPDGYLSEDEGMVGADCVAQSVNHDTDGLVTGAHLLAQGKHVEQAIRVLEIGSMRALNTGKPLVIGVKRGARENQGVESAMQGDKNGEVNDNNQIRFLRAMSMQLLSPDIQVKLPSVVVSMTSSSPKLPAALNGQKQTLQGSKKTANRFFSKHAFVVPGGPGNGLV